MSDDTKNGIIIATALVLVIGILTVAVYLSSIRSQENDRLCIQAGGDVINGNCIRRVK